MGSKQLFTRVPYYPDLRVLFEKDAPERSMVLSLILYWSVRDLDSAFDPAAHTRQMCAHLRLEPPFVEEAMQDLIDRGILKKGQDGTITTDLITLSRELTQKGVNADPRMLSSAADDSIDLYAQIQPSRMSCRQGILGQLCGGDFDRACATVAAMLSALAEEEGDFLAKALAPGWKLMVSPPVKARDICARFTHRDERAIDLGFADATFFMPDGNEHGSRLHALTHKSAQKEPRVLASAVLLGICDASDEISFVSDLHVPELKDAVVLLHRLTGIVAHLGEEYYGGLFIDDDTKKRYVEEFGKITSSF